MLQLSSPITSVRLASLFSMRTNRNQHSKKRFQSASSCGLQRFFPFFFHLIAVEVRLFPQQFPAGVQQLITGIGRQEPQVPPHVRVAVAGAVAILKRRLAVGHHMVILFWVIYPYTYIIPIPPKNETLFFYFFAKKSASPDAEKNPALANGIFIIKKTKYPHPFTDAGIPRRAITGAALLSCQFLVQPEQPRHALRFGMHLAPHAVGFHDGAVVGLMGAIQFRKQIKIGIHVA